jgi:hypothetical protein
VKPGDNVLIKRSGYSDIYSGDTGTIVGRYSTGFAVEVTTSFADAFGKRSISRRCVFFEANEIEPAGATQERQDSDSDVLGGS